MVRDASSPFLISTIPRPSLEVVWHRSWQPSASMREVHSLLLVRRAERCCLFWRGDGFPKWYRGWHGIDHGIFLFCHAGAQENRLLELEFLIRAVGNTVAADTRYRSPVQPKPEVNLRLKVRSCEARPSVKGREESGFLKSRRRPEFQWTACVRDNKRPRPIIRRESGIWPDSWAVRCARGR
jgi:hypothetical protein